MRDRLLGIPAGLRRAGGDRITVHRRARDSLDPRAPRVSSPDVRRGERFVTSQRRAPGARRGGLRRCSSWRSCSDAAPRAEADATLLNFLIRPVFGLRLGTTPGRAA